MAQSSFSQGQPVGKASPNYALTQTLTIEPLNDDELPQSTNEDYEPNAGDKYSQLGDSATVAVLDGTVRAMMGVVTVDRFRSQNW